LALREFRQADKPLRFCRSHFRALLSSSSDAAHSALKAEPLITSAGSATRPAGVAKTDANMAVIVEGTTGALWYNPETFVLDEFDLATLRISYKRVPSEQ
jgi:hypothetical protein